MHEPEYVLGAVPGLTRERGSPVLAGKTGLAESIRLIDDWQTADHVLARERPERLEANVAVPRVPEPRILASMYNEADRTSHAQAQHIQAPVVALYACEQAPARVSQLKDALADVCVVGVLVQLTQAHDVAA